MFVALDHSSPRVLRASLEMFASTTPALAAPLRARGQAPRAPRRALTVAAASGSIRREVLDRSGRSKLNTVDDRNFYAMPRLCTHVDDAFLGQLTELYRQKIPPGGRVFDICSSWVSHLPPDVRYEEVVCHGMNAEELMKNPRLDKFFDKNLNAEEIVSPPPTNPSTPCCAASPFSNYRDLRKCSRRCSGF